MHTRPVRFGRRGFRGVTTSHAEESTKTEARIYRRIGAHSRPGGLVANPEPLALLIKAIAEELADIRILTGTT